jgi:hypothetical protein
MVSLWRRNSCASEACRSLIAGAPTRIERTSTQYLILLRATLPAIDSRKCSKWAAALDAADYYEVSPGELVDFLGRLGGIEGAARERARLWADPPKNGWAIRSARRGSGWLTCCERSGGRAGPQSIEIDFGKISSGNVAIIFSRSL